MAGLPGRTWFRLLGWLAIGLVIYLLYGVRRSKLATTSGRSALP
jgi:APA family basic amino acid/polyamine antiporter